MVRENGATKLLTDWATRNWARLKRFGIWLRLLAQPSRSRLRVQIQALKGRLKRHEDEADPDKQPHIDQVRSYFVQAKSALKMSDVEGGWTFLNAALRQEIYLLKEAEAQTRLVTLKHEVEERLQGWRKLAVEEVLRAAKPTPAEGQTEEEAPVSRIRLVEATKIRDEENDHRYFRRDMVRSRMAVLSFALAALVVLFLWAIIGWTASDIELSTKPLSARHIAGGCLLGAIGACLSGLMSFASKERIPDQFTSIWVTVARPLIGGASGLFAVFVMHAGLFNIDVGLGATWALCFAFGFSERLVLGTMERIEKR